MYGLIIAIIMGLEAQFPLSASVDTQKGRDPSDCWSEWEYWLLTRLSLIPLLIGGIIVLITLAHMASSYTL